MLPGAFCCCPHPQWDIQSLQTESHDELHDKLKEKGKDKADPVISSRKPESYGLLLAIDTVST